MPSVLANSITNWNVSILCCCCRQVASVMFDSVRPHGLQPTRLLRPWDFPGNNTGVGCHCLLPSYVPGICFISENVHHLSDIWVYLSVGYKPGKGGVCLVFFFQFFFFCHTVCGILDSQPGTEPVPSTLEAWSPNHWTAREVPGVSL